MTTTPKQQENTATTAQLGQAAPVTPQHTATAGDSVWERFIAPRPSQLTNQLLFKGGKPVQDGTHAAKVSSSSNAAASWGASPD